MSLRWPSWWLPELSVTTRADLAWALRAVLPHVGAPNLSLDRVTLSEHLAWATDRYTIGVAALPDALFPGEVALEKREAEDLMRFVRPSRVAEHEEEVVARLTDSELHIGLNDCGESAVFETVDSAVPTSVITDKLSALSGMPNNATPLIFQPALWERFAKAKRDDSDRMYLYPKSVMNGYSAALLVTADHFVGSIGGMTLDCTTEQEGMECLQKARLLATV